MRMVVSLSLVPLMAAGCSSGDLSLGCLKLAVSCPPDMPNQRWREAITATATTSLEVQGGNCGSWLAYIHDGGTARYDGVDWGTPSGPTALRVLAAAWSAQSLGGTATAYVDADMSTPIATCTVPQTSTWYDWQLIDCGSATLTGTHSLTFQFAGASMYVINLAAFGLVPPGAGNCTITGPPS